LYELNQKDACDTPHTTEDLYTKRPIGYDLILYAREKKRGNLTRACYRYRITEIELTANEISWCSA
jgi:hypothetical protein